MKGTSPEREIGLFGGSFDPPTLAHLLVAEWVRDALSLDQVWLMPAWINPLKRGREVTDPDMRLAMLQAAVGEAEGLIVRDDEIRRGGPSYTAETVRELQARYPEHRFRLILGADSVQSLPQWKEVDDLLSRVRIAAVVRPGSDLQDVPDGVQDRITTVDIPALPISSTLVRRRIREGRTVRFLVPDPVLEIIEREGLYGEA